MPCANIRGAQDAYAANPESYKEYFESELAWLEWVLETRDRIQANPQDYFSEEGGGHVYVAEYEGVSYGFDSIIELPQTFTGIKDIPAYNRERREALRLIRDYRDQLSAWLKGSGGYPDAWGIQG